MLWIYLSPAAIQARLALSPAEGFCLDYWLMLHSPESFPLLAARPFGLRSLHKMALTAEPGRDGYLVHAIGQELARYRNLADFLSPIPTVEPVVNERAFRPRSIHEEWIEWLKDASDTRSIVALTESLVNLIEDAAESADAETMAFALRRLATEVADEQPAAQALSRRARQVFLHAEGAGRLRDRLTAMLLPGDARTFSCQIFLTPTPIATDISRQPRSNVVFEVVDSKDLAHSHPDLISGTDQWAAHRWLVGLTIDVEAGDPEHAGIAAVDCLRDVLAWLRLRHYIRVHAYGPIVMRDASGLEHRLSRPEPFWRKGPWRRLVPSFPGRGWQWADRPKPKLGSRWEAARWHLAEAVGDWPEDVHSAASEVWQALESYIGGPRAVKSRLREYLVLQHRSMARLLLARLATQADRFRRAGVNTNWLVPTSDAANDLRGRPLADWTSDGWSPEPAIPMIVSDRTVGLAAMLSNWAVVKGWGRKRLSADIDLLYGLRCVAVHRGDRVGTQRSAQQLARTGLELLLELMTADLADLVEALPS
jgi:hypothetical protein